MSGIIYQIKTVPPDDFEESINKFGWTIIWACDLKSNIRTEVETEIAAFIHRHPEVRGIRVKCGQNNKYAKKYDIKHEFYVIVCSRGEVKEAMDDPKIERVNKVLNQIGDQLDAKSKGKSSSGISKEGKEKKKEEKHGDGKKDGSKSTSKDKSRSSSPSKPKK